MRFKLLYIIILSFNILVGQVDFKAKASKTTLGVNERLQIDFNMNKDGDNFTAPSFENFKIAGGPSQSISNSWINGVRSYSKSYTYFLAPTKRGTFTIGQATINVDGAIYKTSPIVITVTAAVDKPKDPNDPEYIASESIHLVAEVSKSNPYLNEAVSVVYKLYVAENTGVRNWNELDTPRYNDFWSQNISVKGLSVKDGLYKGESYRYVILKKTLLYPQKTGELSLEPLTLDVSVEVPSSRRDIFGRQVTTTTSRTVTAGRRIIKVKPLPKKGRPPNFSGAVGEFNFKVTPSKYSLNATEAFNLNLEVSGKGNLKLFELPKPIIPVALEVYEPEHSEKISVTVSGTRGTIKDNYTIVANELGQYPIPPIDFSYFDVSSETYRTIKSGQLVINIKQNPNEKTTNNIAPAEDSSKAKNLDINKFSSFKTSTKLEPKNKPLFYGSGLFWFAFLSPLLLIPIIILYTKKQGRRALDYEGNKIRRNNKLARRYLGEAKKNIGNKESFYVALERALHNYLKAKLKLETSEFSKDYIFTLLEGMGVLTADIASFLKLLEACELARYTPLLTSDMERDFSVALKVISNLDKQLN